MSDDPFLSVSFNQDGTAFVAGTRAGLRAYSVAPAGEVAEVLRHEPKTPAPGGVAGGFGAAAMLFRTNVFALVGGGPSPAAPPHRVLIFDGARRAPVGELAFRSAVLSVALRRDGVAVALAHRALLYSLSDLRLVAAADTGPNPGGALALAAGPRRVLAAPAPTRGGVRVEHVDAARTLFIRAHTARVAALALCADGGLLASASARGTVVRVHRTDDGARLAEFRRGADPAAPLALAFGPAGPGGGGAPHWLAAASDKGTAHLFWVGPQRPARGGERASAPTPAARAAGAARALASRLAPALTAPRSVASFKLPPGGARGCALAFAPDGGEVRCVTVAGAYAAHAVPAGPDGGGGNGGGGAPETAALDVTVLPAAT